MLAWLTLFCSPSFYLYILSFLIFRETIEIAQLRNFSFTQQQSFSNVCLVLVLK